MSKQHETGGPAFPVPEHLDERGNGHEQSIGMTLRDYFAAKAIRTVETRLGMFDEELIADRCYRLADAMLAAREATDGD